LKGKEYPLTGIPKSLKLLVVFQLPAFIRIVECPSADEINGDYVLLAKIGAGGIGQVFKAHH
jgi:hypothetical protein